MKRLLILLFAAWSISYAQERMQLGDNKTYRFTYEVLNHDIRYYVYGEMLKGEIFMVRWDEEPDSITAFARRNQLDVGLVAKIKYDLITTENHPVKRHLMSPLDTVYTAQGPASGKSVSLLKGLHGPYSVTSDLFILQLPGQKKGYTGYYYASPYLHEQYWAYEQPVVMKLTEIDSTTLGHGYDIYYYQALHLTGWQLPEYDASEIRIGFLPQVACITSIEYVHKGIVIQLMGIDGLSLAEFVHYKKDLGLFQPEPINPHK